MASLLSVCFPFLSPSTRSGDPQRKPLNPLDDAADGDAGVFKPGCIFCDIVPEEGFRIVRQVRGYSSSGCSGTGEESKLMLVLPLSDRSIDRIQG
jgi:hypothetical protein